MTIDWKGMSQDMLDEEGALFRAEVARRLAKLNQLAAPLVIEAAAAEKRGPGRPKGSRIITGAEAPRGDLDGEGEGAEGLQ